MGNDDDEALIERTMDPLDFIRPKPVSIDWSKAWTTIQSVPGTMPGVEPVFRVRQGLDSPTSITNKDVEDMAKALCRTR